MEQDKCKLERFFGIFDQLNATKRLHTHAKTSDVSAKKDPAHVQCGIR